QSVDTHPMAPPLTSQVTRQANQRAIWGRVGGVRYRPRGDEAEYRRDVDDRASTRGDHGRSGQPGEMKGPYQIDLECVRRKASIGSSRAGAGEPNSALITTTSSRPNRCNVRRDISSTRRSAVEIPWTSCAETRPRHCLPSNLCWYGGGVAGRTEVSGCGNR